MSGKLRVAAIGLSLTAMAGLVLLLVRPSINPARVQPLPLLIGAWIAFLAAAWLLRKVPKRTAVALILLGGIAVQAAAVSAPPRTSTDLYRYIWDGRVQAAGVDPYQYVPAATQLDGLRNEFLFFPRGEYCVRARYMASHPAADLTPGCTRINRPAVPTIYPPVAEAYFLGVYYLHPADDSTTPIQAATALAAVLITVLLLFGLGRLGRDVRMAALWSWCPTVALEAGNNAHVDVIAVGIAAAAILLLATARTARRTVLGGVLLGLAIATKLTPALTVPALLRRRWVTVLVAAGSAFTVVYVPHALRVGGKVIGFLPGYLQQEGYTQGTRFGIIGLVTTGPLAIAVAGLIMAAVAFAVLQFTDPDRPWSGAVVMTATALAVATPHYQWYSLLLVMLVALDGRPEWLAFAAGGYYAAEPNLGRFTPPSRLVGAIAYGVPLVIVGVGWLVRQELARRAAAGPLPAAAEATTVTTATTAAGAEATAAPELTMLDPAVGPVLIGPELTGPDRKVRVGTGQDRAFLPLGYPRGKPRTAPAVRTVNRTMSYDPSHRMPPRQERWPSATPAEGWPSYRDAGAHRGGEQGRHRYEADHGGAYPATRSRAGYQYAAGAPDHRGYSSPVATETFPPAGTGYGYPADSYGYGGGGYGHTDAVDGYARVRNGYAGTVEGYPAVTDGFDGATDGFDGGTGGYGRAADGYEWDPDGYRRAGDGYADDPDGYEWDPSGYGMAADGFAAGPNDLGPGSHTAYNEHLSGDPRLAAPDAGLHPATWQAEQDGRRQARQRGMLVGAVSMVLGIAVAIGVSTLAAGLLKAQTSPAAAMGSVFIDRTPAALRNALVRHFGPHGRTVLLLGMYAAIAFAALVIGVMARRAAALGVAGIAAFTLVTAFVVITRPASHGGDVTPAVVGGIAGVAALLWLVRAAAPTAPLRPARGGARRRTR